MNAAQGVILIMLGALALYLVWHPQFRLFGASPLVKGEAVRDPSVPIRPGTGGTPSGAGFFTGAGGPPASALPIPPNCVGTFADYWCGQDHFKWGTLVGAGDGGIIAPGRPS